MIYVLAQGMTGSALRYKIWIEKMKGKDCVLNTVWVFNCILWRKKGPTVAVIANPTGPYWGWFNDGIFRSYPLLQLSSCRLPRGWTGRASMTPLQLVHFVQDLGMRWWSLGTMDNRIDCTISSHSSNRSILYPSENVPFGHVQWRQKSTELQIFKIHCCQCAKWWFLL